MANEAVNNKKNFFMRGINGEMEEVVYVGGLKEENLYQVSHDRLFGKLDNVK
jgi:hypothetical protein